MNLENRWFVGFTLSCRERKVGECLGSLGIEYFLPEQIVVRKWSDRLKRMSKLVIPRMIFIHTTELRRRSLPGDVPGLSRFMSKGGPFNPVIIPDDQMDVFIRMVTQTEEPVSIASEVLVPGDHVKVVSGPLEGLECELVDVRGDKCIAVRLHSIGTATMKVSLDAVAKIPETENK